MTTVKQDSDFISQLTPDDLLEKAVQWVQDNLDIEEVFTFDQIENWAHRNGYRQVEE